MGINVLDVQVTENDIVNTVTETDLLSYTVPANTLGSTGALRISVIADYLNNSAASTSTVTAKVKYGSTTMWEDVTIAFPAALTGRYAVIITLNLFAKNATNSQGLTGWMTIGQSGGATGGLSGNLASDEINAVTPLVGVNASEDSTTNKDLKITITHQVADTNISFRRVYSAIESITTTVVSVLRLAGQAFGGPPQLGFPLFG